MMLTRPTRRSTLRMVAMATLILAFNRPASAQTTGETISEERAREIALAAVKGEITDVSIERQMGANRYVVEIVADEDDAEVDVIIDMESGEVLEIDD